MSVYRRSLKKYVPNKRMLLMEMRGEMDERSQNQTKVDWQFFTGKSPHQITANLSVHISMTESISLP